MKRYLKALDIIENTIMVSSMILMLVITFANVLVRKFTTWNFAFSEELVAPLFILLTLVGAAAVARRGGHIGLSALTDLLPKGVQKYIKLFTALVSVFFSALTFYYGYQMVLGEIESGMLTAALQWPEWVFGSFVPVGGFFMTLEFINYGILALVDENKYTDKADPNNEELGAII
jgi:C4-dicarboxylate transporter DctQ subunit